MRPSWFSTCLTTIGHMFWMGLSMLVSVLSPCNSPFCILLPASVSVDGEAAPSEHVSLVLNAHPDCLEARIVPYCTD